jgi:CP family cyanate transporter-like MFS transporter
VPSPRPTANRRILIFIYSLALLQGLTIMLMPPLFRRVGAAFGVGMARQGQLQSAFYFGALIVGLGGGILFDRLGAKRAAVGAILLIGIGACVMGTAPSHPVVIAGCVLFGMGNGWLSVVFAAPVALRFNERRQKIFTWAMLFLAVGGMIGPYLLSFVLERAPSWRSVLLGLGGLLLAGGVLFAAVRTPVLDTIRRSSERREGSYFAVLRRGRLGRSPQLFLLHGVSGGILVAWVGRLYPDRLSISDERAALLLSVNAAGFFIGRLILGIWLAGKLPDRVLLGICAGGGAIAYVLVVVGYSYTLALVVMCGFGMLMSGDAPSIHSFVARQFASSAALAFAAVQTMGALGSSAGPWFTGWLGETYGLHRAIWFGPLFLSSLCVMSFGWELVDRLREGRAPAATAIAERP